jgi:CIC family chloride channel protein
MEVIFFLLLGLASGLVVSCFVLGVGFFNGLWQITLPHDLVSVNAEASLTWSPTLAMGLTAAALLAGQILKRLPGHRQRSLADSLWAAHEETTPELKAGFLSSLMGFINLCGGASVGIFGPTVNLGACLGSALCEWCSKRGLALRLTSSQVIAAGAGAALASLYIVPLAGIAFAFEGILKRFSWPVFGGITLACLVSYSLSHWGLDRHSPLPFLEASPVTLAYVLGTLVFSVVCSLCVLAYLHLMIKFPSWSWPKKVPIEVRPLVPALLLFAISPWLPQLLGAGVSSAHLAMAGALTVDLLLTLALSKVLMTPFCFGFGFMGGIVGPALFIGAMVGALADQSGLLAQSTHFSLIGAAIGVGAVIGAPLSACIMLAEMTACPSDALFALLGCAVAIPIIKRLFAPSLLFKQLAVRGLLLPE